MNLPTRIEIRRWLAEFTRDEILERLAVIRAEHGEDDELDIRYWLNYERKRVNDDDAYMLMSPAEQSLNDHELHKQAIAADIESQKRLYGDAIAVA